MHFAAITGVPILKRSLDLCLLLAQPYYFLVA